MKNLKKLLVVFFFTVAVMAFALSYTASAEVIEYPVSDGENDGSIYFNTYNGMVTGADKNLKIIDIPAEINGVEVIGIADYAFMETGKNTSEEKKHEVINIPSGIKIIGEGAFAGCRYLREINVDDENTSFCDIDGVLCNYNGTVLFSYPNAKEGTDGDGTYFIPESITQIYSYAFTDTQLEMLCASNVERLSSKAFTGVNIDAILVKKPLLIYYNNSFCNDSSYSWYTELGYIYCDNGYSSWNEVTDRFSVKFESYLNYVKTAYPVEGGNIYYDKYTYEIIGCDSSMTAVDIPAEINGHEVSGIKGWAFDLHYNLQSVNIPATVKEVGAFAFYECNNLKSITVDDANPYLCDVDGVLFNRDITEIIAFPTAYTNGSYALPETVTRIGSGAFVHVSFDVLDISSVTKLGKAAFVSFYIQNLYANANVNEYYLYNYNADFERSFMEDVDYFRGSKLYNVYFTGDSVGPWKDILKSYGEDYICNFEGKIESYPLDGGKIYYDSLTGTITGAENVSNLDIPEEINGTKIVAIAEGVFAPYVGYQEDTEYYRFNRVTIPKTIETIGENAFYGANISEIVICDGVKLIGDYAFMNEWGGRLTSLTIANSVTYIGINAFAFNDRLTNLTIPGSVKTIGRSAFVSNKALETLILEEGIETICRAAFADTKITELIIPQSVKTIEAYAFKDCKNLESVTYYSTTDVDESAFANCSSLKNITILRPPYITCDEAGHEWGDWKETVASDCINQGYESRSCIYCSEIETRSLPIHDIEYFAAKEPKCHEAGNIEHWLCKRCNRCWVDEELTQPVESGNPILPQLRDSALFIKADPSQLVGVKGFWYCNECDQHWLDEALTMRIKMPYNHHTEKEVSAVEPTCHSDGNIGYKYCTDCGAYWTMDGEIINALSVILPKLKDAPEHVEAKNATSTEDGNVEYWYCSECDQYWLDEALTQIIDRADVIIPKLEKKFIDVQDGKWYTEGILYCYHKDYMTGITSDLFGYKETLTRALFVTILAKINGAELSEYTEMSFVDVKADQWYSASVEWAYQNGYASGIGDGMFGYKQNVTREQIAMFFYTYSEKNGVDVSGRAEISGFADYGRIHEYALDAMSWAVDVELISGTSETALSPRDPATRAEISVIVMNYVENIE